MDKAEQNEFFAMEPGQFRLLHIVQCDIIDAVSQHFQEFGVTLEPVADSVNPGYMLYGFEETIRCVIANLKATVEQITQNTYNVDQALLEHITSTKGKTLLESIEKEFKVAFQLPKLISAKSFHLEYDVQLPNSCQIKVVHGDITAYGVDVIVNAANSRLQHGGGVAEAIVIAGGSSIQDDCDAYLRRRGREMKPGEVFASEVVGSLPCKMVMHAVTPEWDCTAGGDNSRKPEQLKASVMGCLNEADSSKMTSIAIPALATGIFKYPLIQATDIICETVYGFFKKQTPKYLREVHLLDIDPSKVSAFKQSLTRCEHPPSRARTDSRKVSGFKESFTGHEHPPSPFQRPDNGENIYADISPYDFEDIWLTGTTPQSIKTSENLEVSIKHASIVAEKVDVIVSPLKKLQKSDLIQGCVSSKLLKACGADIKTESSHPKGVEYSDVVKTTAGKLTDVQKIYHGACKKWDGEKGESTKVLSQFIRNCLKEADNDKWRSIAFSALGTGKLNFDKSTACKIMMDSIMAFSKGHPKTTVKDVRITIEKKDIFKVYDAYCKALPGTPKKQVSAKVSRRSTLQPNTDSEGASQEINQGVQPASPSSPAPPPLPPRSGGSTRGQSESKADKPLPALTDPQLYYRDTENPISGKLLMYAMDKEVFKPVIKRLDQIKEKQMTVSPPDVVDRNKIPGANQVKIEIISDLVDRLEIKIGHLTVVLLQEDITEQRTQAIVNPTNATLDFSRSPVSKAILRKAGTELEEYSQLILSDSGQILGNLLTPGFKLPCESIIHLDVGFFSNIGESIYETLVFANQKDISSVSFPAIGTGGLGYSSTEMSKITMGAFIKLSQTSAEPCSLTRIHICVLDRSILGIFHSYMKSMVNCEVGSVEVPNFLNDSQDNPTEDKNTKTILDKPIHQKCIRALDPYQKNDIKALCDQHHVKVRINQDDTEATISFEGLSSNIVICENKVKDILLEALDQAEYVYFKSKILARWVLWEYSKDGIQYKSFPPSCNTMIEEAYIQKKTSISFEEEKEEYRIDFSIMKLTIGKHSATYSVKRCLSKSQTLPVSWEPMAEGEQLKLVQLGNADEMYKDVVSRIAKTYSTKAIMKIERLQNPDLFRQYLVHKDSIERSNPAGTIIERILFHGTSAEAISSINAKGFNRSYCGKNATVYGKGVYFASDASYSADDTYSPVSPGGVKYMYLARVLTGLYTKGNSKMVVPPAKNKNNPDDCYDCVVNDTKRPTVFVVFYDGQVYPEYLITFRAK